MFSKDFLEYWWLVVIVFEITEIMTKFLACGGGLSCKQVWGFTWCFFFRNWFEKEDQKSFILNYCLQNPLVVLQFFKRLPM